MSPPVQPVVSDEKLPASAEIVVIGAGIAGTTAAYKQVSDKLRLAGPFVRMPNMDLDAYVTEKALDGLFTLVAEEEQRIRENPAARTTDLLKSVFGSLRK